jgi:hypothetical protein
MSLLAERYTLADGTKERTFHYVRNHNVPDWMRCGWLAYPSLQGIHHGEWSTLCEWLCSCKMPRPGQ